MPYAKAGFTKLMFYVILVTADSGMKSSYSQGLVGIRRFQIEDVPALFAAARESIDDLCRWMIWCRRDYSQETAHTFVSRCDADWDSGTQYSFVIYHTQAGEFLGSVGISSCDMDHKLANLGYWVRAGYRGRGIGPVAVKMAATFAFEALGLQRLELIVPVGNQASIRVAEKAGATAEAVARQRLILHEQPTDAVIYALLADATQRKTSVQY
jgi:RimJ/RimL family protein N-acetyltransferase